MGKKRIIAMLLAGITISCTLACLLSNNVIFIFKKNFYSNNRLLMEFIPAKISDDIKPEKYKIINNSKIIAEYKIKKDDENSIFGEIDKWSKGDLGNIRYYPEFYELDPDVLKDWKKRGILDEYYNENSEAIKNNIEVYQSFEKIKKYNLFGVLYTERQIFVVIDKKLDGYLEYYIFINNV